MNDFSLEDWSMALFRYEVCCVRTAGSVTSLARRMRIKVTLTQSIASHPAERLSDASRAIQLVIVHE